MLLSCALRPALDKGSSFLAADLRTRKEDSFGFGVYGVDSGSWPGLTLIFLILFRMQSSSSCSSYQLLSYTISALLTYSGYSESRGGSVTKCLYIGISQIALMNSLISIRTLSLRQTQLFAFSASGIQLGSAKFTASAILKPALKPEWYAAAREIMNSLGL